MKCPYIINEEQKEIQIGTQDDFSEEAKIEKIFNKKKHPVECLEQDCAAWQDGKCNYKG